MRLLGSEHVDHLNGPWCFELLPPDWLIGYVQYGHLSSDPRILIQFITTVITTNNHIFPRNDPQ